MKSALYPADCYTWLAIALTAAAIAVVPPMPRLWAVGWLCALPLLAWMASSAIAWLGLFLGAALLLPPLPASFGNSGAHPAVVLAAFGVYAGLIFAHRWRCAGSSVIPAAAVLIAVMAASVPLALIYSGPEVAVGSAVRVLLFALGPFVLAYVEWGPGRSLAHCGAGPARLLFATGVLSAILACVDFFYQLPAPAGYSPQFIWFADRVLRRAQGLFYDAGALGNMCAFFLVMAVVAMMLTGRAVVNRWLAAVGAIPLAAAMVFSYSRAAVLNVVVATIVTIWLKRCEVRWIRTAATVVAAGVVVVLALGWLAPGLAAWWMARARKTVELAFSASDAALSGRVSTWQAIISFIIEHPARVLFGVGYKTLPYSDVLGHPVIADNTYLSTLIETGVAGLAALCALHVAILRATYRVARSAERTAAFYGTWAFSFWTGEMVQMSAADLLTYWRLLPLFFFVIGIAILKGREQSA
jgi:O-antigen ligase